MPRTARLLLPHLAHHIVQRGHNREPVFLSNADFRRYLDNLKELKTRFRCKVYAYCLMLNHVHLLLDAGPDPANIAQLMKHLAGRHAGHFSRNYGRCGPVWEGRFRSSPVAPDHLWRVARYIELNPVRARFARHPHHYHWSSCRQKLDHEPHWIDRAAHPFTLGGQTHPGARHYAEFLRAPVPATEWADIRRTLHTGTVTGGEQFIRALEAEHQLALRTRARGRPRRAPAVDVQRSQKACFRF
jgi:putative transposase